MSEKAIVPVGDKQLIVETGKLAKQADGAVTVQLGETIVIVAAVAATKAKEGQDFFPLTVDYREKAAAAGKFPGGLLDVSVFAGEVEIHPIYSFPLNHSRIKNL
jgi:polyribonucleotide nucleotidyltransferase